MDTNKYSRVAVAGHFSPLHSGHIELLKAAKELGDHLTVIVANDTQASNKRAVSFMPLAERMRIVSELRMVDAVVVSIDDDSDVCKTLELLKPDIFASGCNDDHPDAIKEGEVCRELGIKTVYNVGGAKINSSSDILRPFNYTRFSNKPIEGNLQFFTPEYFPLQIGVHEPKEDRVSKLHKHKTTTELLYVERGQIEVVATDENFDNPESFTLTEGESVLFFRGGHSVKLPAGCRVLEVKRSEYIDDKIYAV